MPYEIAYREKYGTDGPSDIYVKLPDKYSVVRLDSSVLKNSGRKYLHGIRNFFREVFLPQGYPETVSEDYWNYQVWDSVQAFCSTLSGTLTTQAIMKGVGVGDSSVTPLSAAITWILKDGTGMVGRILFAWWKGTSLDADCKKWRLFADILNDFAMCIEMFLLPCFSIYSLYILCLTTTMKSIVGVAGGATKAANTQHQAICNNIADVSAKDGSQETCLNLIGSIFGILVLSHVSDSELLMKLLFVLFTIGHVYANYKAVKALKFGTLNRERLLIILNSYLTSKTVESIDTVNSKEAVLLTKGLTDRQLCGYRIEIGCSLKRLLKDKKQLLSGDELYLYSYLSEKRKYMVIISPTLNTIYVPLSPEQLPRDAICGYFHAVILGITTHLLHNNKLDVLSKKNSSSLLQGLEEELKVNLVSENSKNDGVEVDRDVDGKSEKYLGRQQKVPLEAVTTVNTLMDRYFSEFINKLEQCGWNTERHHLPVGEWRGTWNLKCKPKDD